jgi:flagellin
MISIQTNVTSLVAQQNLNTNTTAESNTIEQLTSGYRINSSGDDAAGLAVANQYQADIGQLTQGVQNANNGVSTLQIIDGGLSNISQILNRLETLATESASGTFTGSRTTLNNEYQSDLQEITRQAANIGLNAGGDFNTLLSVYIGGGELSTVAGSSQVSVDLSGPANAVDAGSLGLANTSVVGGGTDFAGNTVNNLNNTNIVFNQTAGVGSTSFAIDYTDSSGAVQNKTVTVAASVAGETGAQFVSQLNDALTAAGITGVAAQIGIDDELQFSGGNLLQATESDVGLVAASKTVTSNSTLLNGGNYQATSPANFTDFAAGQTQTVTVTASGTNYAVNLTDLNADTLPDAITTFNTALAGSGVYAVATPGGSIALEGAGSFQVSTAAVNGAGTGSAFQATAGAVAVAAPTTSATSTGNALNAITAIAAAVQALGLVQGAVGTGENKLGFAINLANSQISSFSNAESSIKDVDVAAAASNLSKEQILQQSSVAALVQANAIPQAVLSLLKSGT